MDIFGFPLAHHCQRAVYAVYAVYTHRVGLTGLGILSPDRLIYAVRRLIIHTTGEFFPAPAAQQRVGGSTWVWGLVMALVMRNDLVLGEHLAMEEFTPAFLWFASICCERQARERRQKAALAQACGSSPSLAETASMQHSLVGHCTLDSQAS